jgi:hypothetical protein
MSWHYESWRHSLSAKGYSTYRSTKKKLNGVVVAKTRHGIPITIKDPGRQGKAYPVKPCDVKEIMDKIPDKYVDGIKEINFRDPSTVAGTKQELAYAQWVRTKEDGGNRINIFSQPYKGGRFKHVEPGNDDPEMLRKHMKNYVIPHEVGHHVAAKKDNHLPIIVEEAKADAFAARENPDDPKILERHINQRIVQFGSRGTI